MREDPLQAGLVGGDASYSKPIIVSKAGSIGGVDVGSSLNALQGPGGYQSIDFPRADSPQLKDARGQHKGVQFDGSWGGGSQGVHTHQAVISWPLHVAKIKICG